MIFLTVCLLAVASTSQAQRGNYNFLSFEQKPYYFGITLAYNNSNFKIHHSSQFILNDSINTAQSITGPGFNLGIVSNLKVGQYFDFRFLPTLSFAEKNIEYTSDNPNNLQYLRKIESVLVELPFHVRYKSAPYNDKRMFVIAGIKYSFDVASDSRARQANELVKISPTDFAVEVGAGIQMFFPYFIFSPEIKLSHGLGNILIFDDNLDQSRVIEKVLSRALTISLHFEG
ncbi:MAG: outer membrane beta-barrel protein [Bacteroidota bacterium]